jgi:hypothetical protein
MKMTVPALVGALLLAGCATNGPAYPVLPPLPAETIPLPPVSETQLNWQPGDWVYTNGSYRYDAGHYVPAAGHSTTWVFAHWSGTPDSPVWVPGGWR